ncbi:pyridoxal phosphate-dependent transferase [Xylariales sp. AK1849]|nr:pyridoxal phosphate-dependent transferase [Xylariales sp. AK1849]
MLIETTHIPNLAEQDEVVLPIHPGKAVQVHASLKAPSQVYHGDVDGHSDVSATRIKLTATSERQLAVGGLGIYVHLADGRKILDACGGAAVSCLGHGFREIIDAMVAQANVISYVPWGFFENRSKLELANWLLQTSNGHFQKTYITCSGSEAMEGVMKLAREYFVWKGQPQRVHFISRDESYHGVTLGSLSLGGHLTRRAPFEELLIPKVHRIPACNPYRQRLPDESDADYVSRKASELERAFLRLGTDTVVAFIAEPVVGAAAGCMPAVPGYFRAMKAICDQYGALFILDEVMCGMGRTGTLHAWEQEGVLPDIQAVGKGLAAGYQPVSAILVGKKVFQEMDTKKAIFTHGHTYQDHPVGCATALKVQQVIQRDGLLANVQTQGLYLGNLLKNKLRHHPNVGDIRGRGLFWGIEFVRNRETKEPFDPNLQISHRIHDAAMASPSDMVLYYGQGCAGEKKGDHVMLMPAYNVTRDTIETIVEKTIGAIRMVLADIAG